MSESKIEIGQKYPTLGGDVAKIDKFENGFYFGSTFHGHVKLRWDASGRQIPIGGTGPFDLVLK